MPLQIQQKQLIHVGASTHGSWHKNRHIGQVNFDKVENIWTKERKDGKINREDFKSNEIKDSRTTYV